MCSRWYGWNEANRRCGSGRRTVRAVDGKFYSGSELHSIARGKQTVGVVLGDDLAKFVAIGAVVELDATGLVLGEVTTAAFRRVLLNDSLH